MGCAASSENKSAAAPAKEKGATAEKVENAPAPAKEQGQEGKCSNEFQQFKDAFSPLCLKTPESLEKRTAAYQQADPNGNGQCSLAELDAWVKSHLLSVSPGAGEAIWKQFRACYMRAFMDAKDIGADQPLGSTKISTDDFVQKRTFRVFVAYLVIYAEMYDAFALIDGGGAGIDGDDDRKISLDELKAGIGKLSGFSFECFNGLDESKADSLFQAIDADGKGAVLLIEWCRFIEQAEQKAGTEAGKLLAIGDDEKQ